MKQRTDKLFAAMPGALKRRLSPMDVNRFIFWALTQGTRAPCSFCRIKPTSSSTPATSRPPEATVKEAEVILEGGKALEQVWDIPAAQRR